MQKYSFNPERTIAVFDFDGTLTRKDSFPDFLIYTFGYFSFIKGIGMNVLPLTLYFLKIISNSKAKEKLFGYFFSGWQENIFNATCVSYALTRLSNLVHREALEKAQWHRSQKHLLVITSASLSNWILPWAQKNHFTDVIATEPEIKDGLLTGRFKTRNCYGNEKLARFLKKYPQRDQYYLYAYGDSAGDKSLLSIADKPFYRSFS